MTTKNLFVLAGAAASLSSVALADQPAVSRDEVRAIVSEMLSDAETRSSLLQGGGTAGYDKNFFIASSDNNFRINFSGYSQWRYTMSFRDDGAGNAPTGVAGNDNNLETGFTNHRTYLQFDGHVINPDFKYVINGEFSDNNTGGDFNLRDAFFSYNLGSGWWIKGGQFRLGFLKEENIFDTYQMAAERSVTNFVFTQGRSQGVELGYRADEWRFVGAFSDGLQSANTDFATAAGGPNYAERAYAFTARGDWAFAGKLENFDQFTSKQDDEFAGYIGAALHIEDTSNTNDNAAAPLQQRDNRYSAYTIDAMLKGSGFSLFGAFIGANTDFQPGTVAPDNFDDYGVVLQGAWRFVKETEAFIRYDATFYDGDRNFENDRQDFLTFGVNHYFAGQAARLTVDAILSLQPTELGATAPAPVGGVGVNPTIAGSPTSFGGSAIGTAQGLLPSRDDTSIALRVQFQFMF
ncbi:MAG: hypothetical protein ACKVS8_10015 [Phycisphaerales bacterium]